MNPCLLVIAGSIVALVGCTTPRGRADTAFAKGNYLEAVALYDGVIAANPGDRDAIAARANARGAVLGKLLTETRVSREAGRDDDADAKLRELLERRDTWQATLAATTVQRLGVEVAAATNRITSAVGSLINDGRPLGAEALLVHHEPLLTHADFGGRQAALRASVTSAGRSSCAARTREVTEASPYWSRLVDQYCAHWGQAIGRASSLPHHRGELTVDGSIQGETADELASARTELVAGFRASVWFAASAPAVVHAQLDGQLAATFASRPISITKTWTEQIPYTDYETVQVSYQEPYSDTETTTEQVPTTEYQTRSTPCGDTTCTETVPVTVYHSELRTNTVTKYRTAYRDETRPITRYRDEARSMTIAATERSGQYSSRLRANLDGDLAEVVATITSDFAQQGVDHDATIDAAGVSPERANLLTREGFVATEHARIRARLLEVLDDRYRARFCAASQYTLETAAACSYLDAVRAPAGVHATLRTAFGADEPLVAKLLVR